MRRKPSSGHMISGDVFVTYFDQRYLARALVMLRSLRRHAPEATILTLCFDDLAARTVLALDDPKIVVVPHAALLHFEPRLVDCASRPRGAFYATHKPVLPYYAMARWPDIARVTHIDTDTHFHASPAPVFAENPDASILLSPHRYPPGSEYWANFYGTYNAGFISWRNDATARACLEDYAEQCIARMEPEEAPGKFMNQGYLDAWPERYGSVHAIAHPGANLAPWNAGGHVLSVHANGAGPQVRVDDAPLVFFHFSRMFRDGDGRWRTDYLKFGEANVAIALVHVFQPYFREVDAEMAALRARGVETLTMEPPANLDAFYHLT